MAERPTRSPAAGWILGIATLATILGSAAWLVLGYVDATLVHGEWLLSRDGASLIPVICALTLLGLAWFLWSKRRREWLWVIVGGALLLGIAAASSGMIW